MSETIGGFTVGEPQCIQRGGYDEQRGGGATIVDVWAVLLDDGVRPVASDFANDGFPQLGDAAGDNGVLSSMVVTQIKWSQDAPRSRVWRATVTYSPGEKQSSEQGGSESTIYNKSWGFRTVQMDLVQDANDGRAVVNSAGEPFDSVPQREVFVPVVSFSVLSNQNPAGLMGERGTVNASEVSVLGVTFAKHAGRLSFSVREVSEDGAGSKYEYNVTIEGAYTLYSPTAPRDGTAPTDDIEDVGWDVTALDCGYNEMVDGVSRPIMLEDESGQRIRPQSPMPLDGGVYSETDTNLHFLRFSAYPELEWSSIFTPN